MKVLGLLRVKNEARWIDRVVRSILPACSEVLVFDDHSTDGTSEICRAIGEPVTVTESPFSGLDEARDKNWMLAQAWVRKADWVVMIDGDELLALGDAELLRAAFKANGATAYSLRILFLWNGDGQIRVDGVYGNFRRPSVFRLLDAAHRFPETRHAGNFHCSSIPRQMWAKVKPCEARLLHLGYRDREDRIRKYNWYRSVDPNNRQEDGYRHIVQGDLPEIPASARLMHAGPLKLIPLQ